MATLVKKPKWWQPSRRYRDKNTIVVTVKMETDISFWDALKLRLAGGQAIQKFIETRVKEAQSCQS